MTLSANAQALWSLLARDFSSETLSERQRLEAHINAQQKALLARKQGLALEVVTKLNLNRASISQSLQKTAGALAQWNEAQALLMNWLTHKEHPTLQDLITLNAVVSSSKPGLRQGNIYTSGVKHVDSEDLNELMAAFFVYLEATLKTNNDLYAAFICRYWILSIHPFAEANGRTSQLFADFYLMRSGYLPQAFFCRSDAYLIGDPKTKPYMDQGLAFKKFAKTLMNAYELVGS